MSLASTIAKDPKSEAYVMPPASLGPAVWRARPGGEGCAGIITAIHNRQVEMTIFPPEGGMVFRKSNVRHSSDIQQLSRLQTNDGCWDYTDENRRMREALAQLGA